MKSLTIALQGDIGGGNGSSLKGLAESRQQPVGDLGRHPERGVAHGRGGQGHGNSGNSGGGDVQWREALHDAQGFQAHRDHPPDQGDDIGGIVLAIGVVDDPAGFVGAVFGPKLLSAG